MSCCGGNCGCGKGCGGCKMYPDFSLSQEKNVEVRIVGVAPQAKHFDDLEMNGGYENDGCNCSCGSSCKCTN